MLKVRVSGFSLSLDGFGAGPEQSLDHPLGKGGMDLHEWLVDTDTFRRQLAGDAAALDQCDPVDEMHLAIVPIALGRGESMFTGLDLPALGFRVTRHEATSRTTHVSLSK